MKTLRWGLIGAGDIAVKRIAPALQSLPDCTLSAVCRRQADRARAFADEFGVERVYQEWQDLISDQEIDAVYIATPVFLHAEQTIAAANAGKHVLCEKPMAMNVAECDRMIAAARENNVRLGIAYYRRFYPVLERVREILVSEEIGKPVFAQMNAFEYFDPPADHPRRWLLDKSKSGGGPMMDFGCHRLEVLTDLFGKVIRTSSLVSNVYFDREVEDTAAVLLHFASGPCGSVVVTHAAREPQDTLDIFGTAGSIHIAGLNSGDLCLVTPEGERKELHPPHENFHLPLIADFTEAVLAGREPRVGSDTGRLIASLEEKIYSD